MCPRKATAWESWPNGGAQLFYGWCKEADAPSVVPGRRNQRLR